MCLVVFTEPAKISLMWVSADACSSSWYVLLKDSSHCISNIHVAVRTCPLENSRVLCIASAHFLKSVDYTCFHFFTNWHFVCFWETSDKYYIHLQTANKERGDCIQQRSTGKAEVFTEFYFLLCLSHSRSICWITKCTYYYFMSLWFLNSTYSYNIHRFHF